MKTAKLDITFHNPNTMEDVVRELIKLSAEMAKAQIINKLLHIKTADDVANQCPKQS